MQVILDALVWSALFVIPASGAIAAFVAFLALATKRFNLPSLKDHARFFLVFTLIAYGLVFGYLLVCPMGSFGFDL